MKILLALLLCFAVTFTHAQDNNPTALQTATIKDPKEIINMQLAALDYLSAMTEQTLRVLRDLQKQIKTYQEIQDAYLQKPEDKDLLFRLGKSANSILEKIKTENLLPTFDTEFINELTLLSQIYKKISLPKP